MKFFAFITLLVLAVVAATVSVSAQSGRPPALTSATPDPIAARSVKELFDEANRYVRDKAAEMEAKKIGFSEARLAQLNLEQRQLAARYATIVATRKDLATEDVYFVAMLNWIAENLDATIESMKRFTTAADASVDRIQTARSILVVSLSKRGMPGEAEEVLAAYLSSKPTKLTEIARMNSELAKSYQKKGDFAKMAPHAAEAFKAAKTLLADASSRARGLDEILDTGMLSFEAYRDLGEPAKADRVLEEMRSSAVETQSTSFYYYATDAKIRYLIETGRKPAGLAEYRSALGSAARYFEKPELRDDVISRLKRREKHYALLGEAAPVLPKFDTWIGGNEKTLDDLKGKVVLLDFWATWCGPCFEAFPHLREWQEDHTDQGLVILGLTRYYDAASGSVPEKAREIEKLRRFKLEHKLDYDIPVALGQESQILYGAMGLPTTVLIDRKGVVRYIATGTSLSRLEELRSMIVKLLAEK